MTSHVGMVTGGKMFCFFCGQSYQFIPEGGLPISEKSMKATRLMCEDFQDRHAGCVETPVLAAC